MRCVSTPNGGNVSIELLYGFSNMITNLININLGSAAYDGFHRSAF
jgi:hypothetical protein